MQRTMVGGRYLLQDPLGRGGMGEVYLACDELLGREVAVKVLRAQHAENPQFVERFRREAKNAAALSHQNIVSVFDAGESADGSPYMAMEYVGGGTLAARIERNGPLDSLEAGGIAFQVACALEEAHEKGVIHRDIKPHNIFLSNDSPDETENDSLSATSGADPAAGPSVGPAADFAAGSAAGSGGVAPGSIKVGDFGIARAAAETAMTETSLILGTVRYLSPEQAIGEAVGPESDLYSLGVVLYEMITGEVPFDAENPIAIAMKHLSEAPTPPREKNPGVSEGIQAITLRLLSKEPQDRYATAAELIDDLERVGRGLAPTTGASEPAEENTEALGLPSRRGPRRHPALNRVFRRSRRRCRIGGLVMIGLLVAGFIFAGAQDGLANLYNGFDAASAQRIEGMQDVAAPAIIDMPISRRDVPGVVGKEEAAAEEALKGAGFKVEKTTQETSASEEGTVISQDPQSGGRVQRGSTVTITVATAPATAPAGAIVPDLSGLSIQNAEARLSEAGLILGGQDEAYSDSVAAGLILSQSSGAGTELEKGAGVGVTVSLGPEPVAAPAQEPAPAPAPPSRPTPVPEQEASPPNPGTQPAPDAAPEPTPRPQPVPEAVPEAVPEPAPESVPEEPQSQVPDQVQDVQPESQPEPQTPPVVAPEPPAPGAGGAPSADPGGSNPVVPVTPVTPEPVDPVMPDVFDD